MRHLFALLLLTILVGWTSLQATLRVVPVLSSNMVLQREKPLPIWGDADTGARVTVRFGGQKATTVADADGHWQVTLKAMAANAKPQIMTITAGKERLTFENILVGEVWIAGGQSNMEFNMGPVWRNGSTAKVDAPKHGPNVQQQELERADAPLMRLLLVEKVFADTLPATGWTTINQETLPAMSACGYFFAKNLIDSLQVPVGIIVSCWGGSRIESWTPEDYYLRDAELAPRVSNHRFDDQAIGDKWRGMIRPLAPFALRGVIWYQGESNLTTSLTKFYPRMEQLMVQAWRNRWNDEDLAFYCVQISPYLYTARRSDLHPHTFVELPEFRRAQLEALQLIPHSGMALTIDLCDDVSDIHPTYKWEVGRRLALQALSKTYGHTDLLCEGPVVQSKEVKGDEVTVTFDTHGLDLVVTEGDLKACFMIAGPNHRYQAVTELRQEGNSLVLKAAKVSQPTYLRFGWDEKIVTNLRDSNGLPVDQFDIALTTCGPTPAKGKRVLYIGDSITDGAWGNNSKWNATSEERNQTDMNHIYGHGYMSLCASYYQGLYPEADHHFWNRGISGNTLRNLHARWDRDVIALQPDVVSILIGTNDVNEALGRGDTVCVADWESEFRQLLDTTLSVLPEVRFVICTPFVARTGRLKNTSDYDVRERNVGELAAAVRRIAADYKATLVPFDELFESLHATAPTSSETYWIWDGIHPTPAGHYRMAELWKERAGHLIVVQ